MKKKKRSKAIDRVKNPVIPSTDKEVIVRIKAFGGRLQSRKCLVSTDGTVRVYDPIAHHYTLRHGLSRQQELRIAQLGILHPKANPGNGAREIYGRLLRIEAQKGAGHVCDAACKKANHCYFHDFSRHARVFGLPDGSLWITDKNNH